MKVSAIRLRDVRHLSSVTFGVALSALLSSAALAQMQIPGAPAGAGNIATGGHSGAAAPKPQLEAPAAIPGAKAREPVAPSTRAATDMQPTDALFDAINRGDIAAARDALNRGADLNGVNILGMSPMELSVDLGRNDISFLLLSMRGEDSGRGSRAAGQDNAAPAPASKTAQTAKPGAPAKRAPVASAPVAPKPGTTPKLYANDGGTPLPGAGFLGFGSGQASN
jgi:hypothetical protein